LGSAAYARETGAGASFAIVDAPPLQIDTRERPLPTRQRGGAVMRSAIEYRHGWFRRAPPPHRL